MPWPPPARGLRPQGGPRQAASHRGYGPPRSEPVPSGRLPFDGLHRIFEDPAGFLDAAGQHPDAMALINQTARDRLTQYASGPQNENLHGLPARALAGSSPPSK